MATRFTFLFLVTLTCSVMVEDISASSDTAQLKPSSSGATRRISPYSETLSSEMWTLKSGYSTKAPERCCTCGKV
ncbi:hypothetical protein Mapa_012153 [Marchantia paleacea]|nr:hypothetical protein Mapa_012153 [Marchantia paleacea]